jgi:hypothetical protein
MNAIYRNKLYSVVDTEGDGIILDGPTGHFVIPLNDPRLTVDPTDDEYFAANQQTEAMRDDINKLPLSKDAKAYARRTGLKSMMDQPKQFMKVNAQILNAGKPNKMKNYDVGEQTDGKKGAPKKAFKESFDVEPRSVYTRAGQVSKESAGEIVDRLLNG